MAEEMKEVKEVCDSEREERVKAEGEIREVGVVLQLTYAGADLCCTHSALN